MIDEGTTDDPKQAAAICYSFWRKAHAGSKPTKAIDFTNIDKVIIKYRDEELTVDGFLALIADNAVETKSHDAFIQLHWQDISIDEYDSMVKGDKTLNNILVGKAFCAKVRVATDDGLDTQTIIQESVANLISNISSENTVVEKSDVLPSATEDDVATALKYDLGEDAGSFWFAHDDGYDYIQLIWTGEANCLDCLMSLPIEFANVDTDEEA